jgi:hypothetical protein
MCIATRIEDHLMDLLDFFISEIVKVGEFITLGTEGSPRSGNGGRDSTRRRRKRRTCRDGADRCYVNGHAVNNLFERASTDISRVYRTRVDRYFPHM